jgi:hypothetical protein
MHATAGLRARRPYALPGILKFLLVLPAFSGLVFAAREPAVPPDPGDWRALHRVVRPAENESPWRKIAWLTDVTKARKRAAAEGKPLIIFTAADGSPLGRT